MTSSTDDGLRICVHWSIAAETTSTEGLRQRDRGPGRVDAVRLGEELAERHGLVERPEAVLGQDLLGILRLQERGERERPPRAARRSPSRRRAP